MSRGPVSWQIVTLLLATLAGSAFLGYEHILRPDVVGSIYVSLATGATVGHFSNGGGKDGGI